MQGNTSNPWSLSLSYIKLIINMDDAIMSDIRCFSQSGDNMNQYHPSPGRVKNKTEKTFSKLFCISSFWKDLMFFFAFLHSEKINQYRSIILPLYHQFYRQEQSETRLNKKCKKLNSVFLLSFLWYFAFIFVYFVFM